MNEKRLDNCIWEWLTIVKKNSVKSLTYDRLLISFKLLQTYPIAGKSVDEIRSTDIQGHLNLLVEDGYAMSTIRKQFNLITAYWKWAMSQGFVKTAVYLGAKLPCEEMVKSSKKDIQTYTPYEQSILLDSLLTLEHVQYAAAVLMLEAGLRIGEVLALSWSDVLWSRRAIYIHRTLIRESSAPITFIQESAKSKSSKRTVPLSSTAMDALERLNFRKSSDELIFAREDDPSMPYSYSSIEYHIRRLCKDLEIPYLGLHAFRHTFATNCYERGCDVKILSKLLGHSDVSITYNIYIHLYGDALEEMRKVLD